MKHLTNFFVVVLRKNNQSMEPPMAYRRIGLMASWLGFAFFVGCSSSSSPPAQQAPTEGTRIEAGIYTGTVECEFTRQVATQGIVENYVYDFNETFVFDDTGLPQSGAAYNPDDDKIALFGTVFDVLNRTYNVSDFGLVTEAVLTGTVEGDRVDGLITWTFLYDSPTAIRYLLDIAWTSSTAGIAWSVSEDCSGVLTK